jgi:single-strand DNA-binding protein
MNKVIILGNMTRKAELRTIPSGNKVANFSIAVSEKYKDKQGQWVDKAEFVNCVAWGRTAEVIDQYLDKGSKILVEGKLQTSTWDKDGEKRYKTEVIVSSMEMLGNKPQGQAPKTAPSPDVPPDSYGGGFSQDEDSDLLPF